MVDTAVDFLCEKCEELTGRSVNAAANQLSGLSCEQSDLRPQSATALASGTSYRRQSSEPVQPAESDQNNSSSNRKVEGQIRDFNVRQDAVNEDNKTRLQNLETQLQKLSTTQDRMREEMESQTELTEKQLQKLSTSQDIMKEEMESQTELTEKLVHVPDQLESVKEKIDVLDARIGRIMNDCSNKHQDIEHVTRDLADKVMASTETVKVISVDQDQKTSMLRELETKMQTLEADSGRHVKQAEKGEAKLRILCQMLNDRLTPLEQLRTCLAQLNVRRDENNEKLTQVIQQVAVMSPRLQQLEVKSSRTRCGFTALASFSQVTGHTVRPYLNPETNVGGNFDADSGIFTAPVDGLYVASISIHISENTTMNISVRYHKQSQSVSTVVCGISACVKGTTACNVGFVQMSAGDIVSLYVHETMTVNDTKVRFTCFLLS